MTAPSERKKAYLQRKKEGLCPRCGGKRRKNSKFVFCEDCRAFYRNYNDKISEKVKTDRETLEGYVLEFVKD